MSLSREAVVERLRRVRGPDMQSNIVDLGLVSEVLLKDGRVSFSITVPAERAAELEPLRQAAEKIVRDMEGVTSRPGGADGREAAWVDAQRRGARRAGAGEHARAAGARFRSTESGRRPGTAGRRWRAASLPKLQASST